MATARLFSVASSPRDFVESAKQIKVRPNTRAQQFKATRARASPLAPEPPPLSLRTSAIHPRFLSYRLITNLGNDGAPRPIDSIRRSSPHQRPRGLLHGLGRCTGNLGRKDLEAAAPVGDRAVYEGLVLVVVETEG